MASGVVLQTVRKRPICAGHHFCCSYHDRRHTMRVDRDRAACFTSSPIFPRSLLPPLPQIVPACGAVISTVMYAAPFRAVQVSSCRVAPVTPRLLGGCLSHRCTLYRSHRHSVVHQPRHWVHQAPLTLLPYSQAARTAIDSRLNQIVAVPGLLLTSIHLTDTKRCRLTHTTPAAALVHPC